MLLRFETGKEIRGDVLLQACLRYDLAPVPATLEADIRTGDEEAEKLLAEGRILEAGNGEKYHIVKSVRAINRQSQGERQMSARRVTALLDNVKDIAFVRSRAIVKENATLSAVYKAAGASIPPVESDFPVPRFYCLAGDTPSFHIARALQEEGGALRWKAGKMSFFRLADFFAQKPVVTLPDNATDNVESGFLERHEAPWFFSLEADASFIHGNRTKPRSVAFSPFKDAGRLMNMTRCLVHRKVMKITYNAKVAAGDLVQIADGPKLVIVTAAHVYETGSDEGTAGRAYTRLWLAGLES